MKKLFFLAFVLPSLSFAFDTSVKGFIALDALNYKKIEGKKSGVIVGIGVLDLKVFAEQDNMTAALKLDLDGKLSEENNIFEEAYASYRGVKDFRFSLGKGVIKYQNLHWGSVQNSYYDGGSVLGTENSFRKLARKAFASVSYGHRSRGFLGTFWFWGDSTELAYDESDNLLTTTSSSKITGYKQNSVTAFDTRHQTGFASKIELYQMDSLTLSAGAVYYKKDLAKRPTYAVDLGINYESANLEIWTDFLVGQTHKLPYENYSTYSNTEYFAQMGMDLSIDESWSWVSNIEGLYTKNESWNYSAFGSSATIDSTFWNRSGQVVKTLSYKAETALKYKLSKTSFVTTGVLYENKISDKNGIKDLTYIPSVYNPNRHAYQYITSVSFWF